MKIGQSKKNQHLLLFQSQTIIIILLNKFLEIEANMKLLVWDWGFRVALGMVGVGWLWWI